MNSMSARKRKRHVTESAAQGEASPSYRGLTTDSVYSLPTSSKFLLGCTLYRYLQEYWQQKGKPFLQRTLLYQNTGTARLIRKRTSNLSDGFLHSWSNKRLKLGSGFSWDCSNGPAVEQKNDEYKSNVEWKPFAVKVVFDAVYDSSGASGSVDLDVIAVKNNGSNIFAEHKAGENGNRGHGTMLRVPRNPPSSATGTNGHCPASITIPLEGGPNSKPPNGAKVPPSFASSWLLCQCKLPLPRTGRRGLRNSAQRRASAASAPLSTDYCFGCLDIGRTSAAVADGNSEITLCLKRLAPSMAQSTSDRTGATNGRTFNQDLFLDLLAENDLDDAGASNMPTVKMRMIQTCIQRRPPHASLSPRYRSSLIQKRDRLAKIVENLPALRPSLNAMDRVDSVSSSSEMSDPVFYQIYIERQRNATAPVETCLNRLTTKLNDPNRCPFCETICADLYALLQHHRLCHPRFSVVLKENGRAYVVEIRPAVYDGRLETRIQRRRYSKRKIIPMRKLNGDTKMMFYRPVASRKALARENGTAKRLDEFKTCPKECDQDARASSEFMLHHARQYYHSQTCQKLLPEEFDRDSEDEMDPVWLRNRTERLIDEFTDVNEGEKSIMKMWNLHILKHNYFGDKQMVVACGSFLYHYGQRIIADNLSNNFLLHLADLYYFGLLSQTQLFRLTKRLHSMKSSPSGSANE